MQAPDDRRRWDETAAASIGCVAHKLLNSVGTVYIKAPALESATAGFPLGDAAEVSQVS